jgi:hypothetical protein
MVGQLEAMCRHYILGCVAAGLLMGCAHSIRLKTVNATTHEPLEGVSVQWVQARHQMFQPLKQEGPANLPPSGPGGIVKVDGLHRWWSSDFTFSHPGCSNVYGIYGSGKLTVSDQMQHFPSGPLQDQFWLRGHLTVADKSNGCFLVEMQQ